MTPEEKKKQEEALLLKIKEQGAKQIEDKLTEIKNDFSELIGKSKTGMITADEFKEGLKPIEQKLEDYDPVIFANYKELNSEMEKQKEIIKAQGTELAKLKEGGGVSAKKQNEALWDEVMTHVKSDSFKQFIKNPKQSVSFELKTVSIENNYTGTIFITFQDPTIVDHPEVTRLNIRSLLRVTPIDLPLLSFLKVTKWDRAVNVVTENGTLPESAFSEEEENTAVKRIGTFVRLSKRILRSPEFIVSHLQQRLPAQVAYFEDFQLLFGDGAGENVEGLFNKVDDFATVINTTKITGVPGDVVSVASFDGGAKTLVTLLNNEDNLFNGDIITFALAIGGQTVYNNPFTVILISPKTFLIEQSFVAGSTAAWTYTVNSAFKDDITDAQQIDVLEVASSLINVQQYRNTGFVLNPIDATKIKLLKGNDNHYLKVEVLSNGIMTIGGIPVIQTTAMPAGKFICGDWSMAAALFQYTNLTLEFAESVDQKLNNTVVAIIQEEILFPIYNKFMFISGDFVTAKAAIGV